MKSRITLCISKFKDKFGSLALLPMAARQRKYRDEYLEYGFSSIETDTREKPVCVICRKLLSSESMKLSRIKNRFEKFHKKQKTFSFRSTFGRST